MIPNKWYAVLPSKAVKPGQITAVKRMGQELAFFRNEKGGAGVCNRSVLSQRGSRILNTIISQPGKWANKVIERQDKRVVVTQRPKASAYRSQEKLLSGDGPIILYRKLRENMKSGIE